MKAYSLFVFVICLNLAAFVINESQATVTNTLLYINPFDVTNQFSLTIFGALGVGGALIGIAALLTRQYVYAAGALLIWVIGIMLPISQWILIGAPIIMSAILPSEISYLTYIVSAFFTLTLFFFLIEIATQRQIT